MANKNMITPHQYSLDLESVKSTLPSFVHDKTSKEFSTMVKKAREKSIQTLNGYLKSASHPNELPSPRTEILKHELLIEAFY